MQKEMSKPRLCGDEVLLSVLLYVFILEARSDYVAYLAPS